ncbi:MAG TPA: DUF1800 domain-containing protein [Puia sp.]
MPYREAGLTEKQAAAHLLSRFTYGATPGQVDVVARMGLEKWFEQQLKADLPEDSLEAQLAPFDALKLSNEEIAATYPKNGQVIRMAVRDGIIDKDSVRTDKKAYRFVLRDYMDKKGYKPENELFRQLYSQKIVRAAFSQNQLREVMTDFWFNHFNVSVTKNDCSQFIPAYERDVIRPNTLGKFGDLLKATAQSPAMLYYLDNFTSSGPMNEGRQAAFRRRFAVAMDSSAGTPAKARRPQGLNENYARELMELHTLGVDGGYTQQDVTQAARVLTGWTVRQNEFFFAPNRHDKGVKTVLGKQFGPDGGETEGMELLDMLAHHPSTAHFICRKIAIRFVNDSPPSILVDKMVKTFMDKNGDIRQVLLTMVYSPEFWSAQAIREKTKSPFELAIGAVRSLHAKIDQPMQLYAWINRMGERMYGYQAPTGFPDKGQYWINTGSLLSRMNFGLALATGRIPGLSFNLAALNNNHEPESAQAALVTYCHLIMPERDLEPTIKRLTPMLNDPNLPQKVNAADGQQADTVIDGGRLTQVVGIIIGSPEFQRR